MAEDSAASGDTPITFHVKSSSDAKYTLTLSPTTTIADLKEKLSTPEHADVPPARQRLIYSGRVLKDEDTLATHKVRDGHTIHLVKHSTGAQRQPQPSQSSSTSQPSQPRTVPGVPTNLAAGTGNNPLAGLTGARYAGFAQLPGAGLFGPDGGMGPPPDSEQLINLLENPQFQSTMNEALQNPQLIDMMIQQNPMLRDMGPGVRQMMQSPMFRRMLTDPNAIRQMTQMQRAMGMGGFGGAGNNAFPAPGVTNTTPEENRQPQNDNNNTGANNNAQQPPNPFAMPGGQQNPFAALFGANANLGGNATGGGEGQTGGNQGTQGTNPNPFAQLFSPALFGQPPADPNAQTQPNQNTQNTQNPFVNPYNNPFLNDPAMLSQMLQMLSGQNTGAGQNADAAANPFAALFPGLGGARGSPAPQDNRPPEERYAEQLRQLNDMGFYEFERNIEALRRTGGSVQGAVEYLLTHQ